MFFGLNSIKASLKISGHTGFQSLLSYFFIKLDSNMISKLGFDIFDVKF